MKSWGFPWFPFVLELLREAAAKSTSPLAKGGYRGVPMARQHGTRQPAPGRRDGHDHRRGAWSDKASRHGLPRWLGLQLVSQAAQGRKIVGWMRQPQVVAMGQSDPPPRTPHGEWSVGRQRFGVSPSGLGRTGDECSFLAWGLRHQAPTCRPIQVLVARARSES